MAGSSEGTRRNVELSDRSRSDPNFRWMLNHALSSRGRAPLLILAGPPGSGKSKAIHAFALSEIVRGNALIVHRWQFPTLTEIQNFVNLELSTGQFTDRVSVLIDQADDFSDSQLGLMHEWLSNYKQVRSVTIATRRLDARFPGSFILILEDQLSSSAAEIIRAALPTGAAQSVIAAGIELSGGSLEVARKVADFIRNEIPIESILNRRTSLFSTPSAGLFVPGAGPMILRTRRQLAAELKKSPENVRRITPRQFEEVLRDIFEDLGYRCELTPPTRDGGKDLLIYMPSPAGEMMLIVEAKRYGSRNVVGIGLVQRLLGTLSDTPEASRAMLVTTSSFSQPARDVERRQPHRLVLKGYGDVVAWIEGYGNGGRKDYVLSSP